MRNFYLIIIILFYNTAVSQSLGKRRIDKIENTIVKITINGAQVGTGFVVSENGIVATCFHVIEPAFVRDRNTNDIVAVKNVKAKFENKEELEIFVLEDFLYNGAWYEEGLVGDYILLAPKENNSKNMSI
ncbi:hypothetical protein [Maribacter sp. 2210JD10-5]|uniref:hypothetical protein n=1 Tax=Maribacter sp. 2210JD10-5 TaxID=3386272 RepID=UPI0039BCE389